MATKGFGIGPSKDRFTLSLGQFSLSDVQTPVVDRRRASCKTPNVCSRNKTGETPVLNPFQDVPQSSFHTWDLFFSGSGPHPSPREGYLRNGDATCSCSGWSFCIHCPEKRSCTCNCALSSFFSNGISKKTLEGCAVQSSLQGRSSRSLRY